MQEIISKTRDLIQDNYQYNSESQEYIISKIFTLQYANIDASSLVVYKNGVLWAASNYSYDSDTGKVTVTGTLAVGDVLEFTYNAYNKYSDTEIRGYIRSALYHLSVEQYKTFIIEGDTIYYSLTGIVAVTNLSATITGTNTAFTTELIIGDTIKIKTEIFTVLTIDSDTSLTLDSAYQGETASGLIAYRIPTASQQNLIAIIASILIKGSIRSYRTPEISITFEEGMSIEQKIKQVLRQFTKAYGVMEYIDPTEKWETE